MTDLLTEGVDLFNSGRYWDAHEVWERDWTPDRKGPDSGFYKGLIQVAAGCLHYNGAAGRTISALTCRLTGGCAWRRWSQPSMDSSLQ